MTGFGRGPTLLLNPRSRQIVLGRGRCAVRKASPALIVLHRLGANPVRIDPLEQFPDRIAASRLKLFGLRCVRCGCDPARDERTLRIEAAMAQGDTGRIEQLVYREADWTARNGDWSHVNRHTGWRNQVGWAIH